MQCVEESVRLQFFSSKNCLENAHKENSKSSLSTANLNKFHEHHIICYENVRVRWEEGEKFSITLTYFLDTFFQEINFRFSSLTNHRQRGFFKRRKRRQKKKNFLRFSLSLTHAVCHSCVVWWMLLDFNNINFPLFRTHRKTIFYFFLPVSNNKWDCVCSQWQ